MESDITAVEDDLPPVEVTTDEVETNPVRVFGTVLRMLRERAGLSQQALAELTFCSPSLISAIERGKKPAKLSLVKSLDQKLNADGLLLKVWPITTNGSFESWFSYVVELEREASKIHEWELRSVPGLLQTPDYARALMRAVRPRDHDGKIENDVNERITRQDVFIRADPPMAWFILDESVLYRAFGGSQVMRDQLLKLEKTAELPSTVIQVLPFGITDHPGMEGPLRILEFPDDEPSWYTEGWYSGRLVETKAEVANAMTCFDLIRASALPPKESLRVIAETRQNKYE